MKRRKKWTLRLGLLLLFLLLLWLLHRPVFIAMGRYLELSSSDHPCDAIVIEGGHTLSKARVEEAIRLWRQGLVRHIIMTLNTQNGLVDAFALGNYKQRVRMKLDSLGLPPEAYSLLDVEVTDPFTYSTARELLPFVKQKGFRSVMIVHDNFHIRRSYLTYKKVLGKEGIEVYPRTVKIYIDATNWWKAANGVRRVYAEYIKLLFYWYKGYL